MDFWEILTGKKKEVKKDIRLPLETQTLLRKELGETIYAKIEDAANKAYIAMRLFPASQSHHDSDKGGLWRHSLDTALALYRLFPKYEREIIVENPLTKNLSYNDTYLQREQYRLLSFLLGLFHDIGKITEYDIYPTKNSRLALNPLNIETFIEKTKEINPETIEIKKRTLRKDMLHCYVSSFLMFYFFPASLRFTLSPFVLAKAIQAIALEHTDIAVDNLFLRMLKQGDSETTATSMETEVKTLAERKGGDYLATLKRGILKGRWDVNVPDMFRVFIDPQRGYVIINPNIAINKMTEELRLTRDSVFEIIRENELCALALNNKEIVLLKTPGLQGNIKSIPAIVFKMSAFEFDAGFLDKLPDCPPYELVSKKDIEEDEKKKEPATIKTEEEEPKPNDGNDAGRDDPVIADWGGR